MTERHRPRKIHTGAAMRATYRALAYTIAALVALQAAFVAYGWFAVLGDLDSGAVFDKNSEWNAGQMLHGMVGVIVLPLVAIVFLIISFFAHIPGGVKWASITFGLTVLQVGLAFGGFGAAVIGALHGLNAFALLAVAVVAASRVARMDRAAAPMSPVPQPTVKA